MRRLRFTAALVTLIVFLFYSTSLIAQERNKIDWDKYGKRLVEALKSTHEGLQLSAMQHAIRYGDSLDVVLARYVVMDKFMNHKSRKVRQLALATLAQIDNPLDIGLLELHLKWEKDPVIKKMIAKVLLEKGRMTITKYKAVIPDEAPKK